MVLCLQYLAAEQASIVVLWIALALGDKVGLQAPPHAAATDAGHVARIGRRLR